MPTVEPDEEDTEYDHDFEPEQLCANCGEPADNCECDDQEMEDQDECCVCGGSEADPVHGNG